MVASKKITLELDADLHGWLTGYAVDQGRSVRAQVMQWIRQARSGEDGEDGSRPRPGRLRKGMPAPEPKPEPRLGPKLDLSCFGERGRTYSGMENNIHIIPQDLRDARRDALGEERHPYATCQWFRDHYDPKTFWGLMAEIKAARLERERIAAETPVEQEDFDTMVAEVCAAADKEDAKRLADEQMRRNAPRTVLGPDGEVLSYTPPKDPEAWKASVAEWDAGDDD